MFNFNPCHKFKIRIRELVKELNKVREERNKLLFQIDEIKKVIKQSKNNENDQIIFIVVNDEFQPVATYTTYKQAYLEASKYGYGIVASTLDQPIRINEKEE